MNYDNPSDRSESADDASAENGDNSKPLWPDMPNPVEQPDLGTGYDKDAGYDAGADLDRNAAFDNAAAPIDDGLTIDTSRTTDLAGPTATAYAEPVVPAAPFEDEARPAEAAEAETDGPARDRLSFHLFLEAGLLVLAGVGAWLVHDRVWPVFDDFDNMSLAMGYLAPYLLLALALGLSMRVGAPNLAVGTVALLATALVGPGPDEGDVGPLLLTAGVAVGAGVILAVLVLVFRLPGWAVSLGIAVAALAWVVQWPADSDAVAVFDLEVGELYWLFTGVATVALAGGLIGLLPAVRERLSACREVTGNGGPRSAATVSTTAAALIGSMVLAAGAGVMFQMFTSPTAGGLVFFPHQMLPDPISGESEASINSLTTMLPFELTLIALAITLLAGTSLRGRRGGILGSVLATILVAVGAALWSEPDWDAALLWLLVAALGLGLLVSWLVDVLGAPKAARPPAEPSEPQYDAAPSYADQTMPANGSLFEPPTRSNEPIDPFARQ